MSKTGLRVGSYKAPVLSSGLSLMMRPHQADEATGEKVHAQTQGPSALRAQTCMGLVGRAGILIVEVSPG